MVEAQNMAAGHDGDDYSHRVRGETEKEGEEEKAHLECPHLA